MKQTDKISSKLEAYAYFYSQLMFWVTVFVGLYLVQATLARLPISLFYKWAIFLFISGTFLIGTPLIAYYVNKGDFQ
jgi:hypothetical protein